MCARGHCKYACSLSLSPAPSLSLSLSLFSLPPFLSLFSLPLGTRWFDARVQHLLNGQTFSTSPQLSLCRRLGNGLWWPLATATGAGLRQDAIQGTIYIPKFPMSAHAMSCNRLILVSRVLLTMHVYTHTFSLPPPYTHTCKCTPIPCRQRWEHWADQTWIADTWSHWFPQTVVHQQPGRAVTNNIPGLVELRREEYNGHRKVGLALSLSLYLSLFLPPSSHSLSLFLGLSWLNFCVVGV